MTSYLNLSEGGEMTIFHCTDAPIITVEAQDANGNLTVIEMSEQQAKDAIRLLQKSLRKEVLIST